VLSTFTLTNNSGAVDVHTYGQNSGTTFTPAGIIQVLPTFALTNNSGTVYIHTYGQNSGTVYVRTYKQLRYCLRSHLRTRFKQVLGTFKLQTTHAQPTAMTFTHPVFSGYIFFFLQSLLPIF
jgi:hypothetical protein